jgi:hypothetical protein
LPRPQDEAAWSLGSAPGGEEVCAYNEDDVRLPEKIRLRWQVCDGADFAEDRTMRVRLTQYAPNPLVA